MMGSCLIPVPKGQAEKFIGMIEEHQGTAELLSDEERTRYVDRGDLLQSDDCDAIRAWLPPGVPVHKIFGGALNKRAL